jgi:hypothetical protein
MQQSFVTYFKSHPVEEEQYFNQLHKLIGDYKPSQWMIALQSYLKHHKSVEFAVDTLITLGYLLGKGVDISQVNPPANTSYDFGWKFQWSNPSEQSGIPDELKQLVADLEKKLGVKATVHNLKHDKLN